MLTPTQKTQLGTGLLQEAVIEVLNQQGGSATQAQIQENLGLTAGTQSANLSNSILTQLVNQNQVTQTGQGNQSRYQLTNQRQKTASTGRE